MFPDVHPSKGSVPNMGIGLGCPAIIFDQMSSDQWKSTTRAQIDERQPTFKKGRRVGLPAPPAPVPLPRGKASFHSSQA